MAQPDHDKRIDYIELPVDDVDLVCCVVSSRHMGGPMHPGPLRCSCPEGRLRARPNIPDIRGSSAPCAPGASTLACAGNLRGSTLAKTFYQTVFGWKFTDYGPDYSSFEDGRLSGGLHGGRKGSRGGALVVIYAVALEAVRDAVVFSGGKIVVETHEFPGGRRFHFTDPAGNELAVWSDV